MYKNDPRISIAEFNSPFGKLNPNNRWVQIADMIPWHTYEKRYAKRFCPDNGAPAIKFRMALGTLIIKQMTKHSDDEVLQDIIENPYMQFLIGLHEFTMEAPFAQSSITNFRKYITPEMMAEINDELFRKLKKINTDDDRSNDNDSNDNNPNSNDHPGGGNRTDGDDNDEPPRAANKGELLLDATCAPAYIAYPTDINLLNEAREKLETIIDTLHPHTAEPIKPRTYRRNARRSYLKFAKNRKPSKNLIRKTIKQQLQYVDRDLKHIDRQFRTTGDGPLNNTQRDQLHTIRELYTQQRRMYETKTHSIEDRIVSINQPHVRPIVRGKTNAPVEFGAKVSISLVDGYAFIDKLSWDAYNEQEQLIPAIKTYRQRYGVFPEAVLADTIYRNRDNRAYCKKYGIRLSGPRLGRPPKEPDKSIYRQERQDASKRNAIEGKFGEGKVKYGLDRIMARLKGSSETIIVMAFFCMNINRRLRVLFYRFLDLLFSRFDILAFGFFGVYE